MKEGYKLVTKNISYNLSEKILNSNNNSTFTDMDGNIIETTMFQYSIEDYLFSALGEIKINQENNAEKTEKQKS